MKNLLAILSFLSLCIFIGCLGAGGSGSSFSSTLSLNTPAVLVGRAYFSDRQLYGDIPVSATNPIGETVSTVLTDSAGYYAFLDLPAGVYDLKAVTGDSEVTFSRGLQLDGVNQKQAPETALLGVNEVRIFNVSTASFEIEFKANRLSRASVEYGPVGGFPLVKTIGQAGAIYHQTVIDGLRPLTDYEITVYLTGDDGQEFVLRGLFASTLAETGPQNVSISVNEGDYETKSQNVTLFLEAQNAVQMRVSEFYDLSDATWVTFSQFYDFSFRNAAAGTKRVYVQFRDADGNTTSVQSDAILMSQTGYLGVWINDGDAITNNSEAVLKTLFPGASQMMVSNYSNFFGAFWEGYTEQKKWKFSAEDGLKTIYCKFKGGKADETEIFTASILLDTTPPDVSIKINNGSTVTATTSVTLSFHFTSSPVQMKVSNTEAPATSTQWQIFKSTLDWVLPATDGEKTVYGLFKDGAGNEYGPISAMIELDTVAPTGNTISVREGETIESEVATFALLASLPVYLHFEVADTTTYEAHYAVTVATTTEPSSYNSVPTPFVPVLLDTDVLRVGKHKIWTRFSDKAGNLGFLQTFALEIDGPQIIVTPDSATLNSGQEQQFAATIKNIDMADVGAIRWRVVSGSGTIDTDGLYTAPAPIYTPSEVVVRADSTLVSTLFTYANVSLETSTEMLFQQRNGQFNYDEIDDQVEPGTTYQVAIQILHSDQGFEISQLPKVGDVSISPVVSSEFGVIATLSYTAPAIPPAENQVTIGVRSIAAPTTVAGTMTLVISTGPNLNLSPTSGDAQRNSPLAISATVTGTSLSVMNWSISPVGMGSFAPDDPNVTNITTVAPDHSVLFYASTPSIIQTASVTASIDGAQKATNITVYPPIRFTIDPPATSSMPIIAPITFKAQGFDYLLGTASEAVTWEFKNANRIDFMPADGKTYLDRGSLTVVDSTTAEYRRPTKLPSESDLTAADSVLIRATSVADPNASATAIATITPKVVVEIFDSIEKIASISTAATVAEVGKIQLFPQVTPTVIGNTSVSWTVNGTAVSYGTIDANGLYTAPDEILVNEVTVRATSNYDPTAYAEVKVSLSEFWLPKRNNMFDSITGEVMPINTILVNPYTASGTDFILYAGTAGYGVWKATFSDQPGNTAGGDWQGISNLTDTAKQTGGKYHVSHLAISPAGRVYAGTIDGIHYINSTSDSALKLTYSGGPGVTLPDENFLKLAFDQTDPSTLFTTTPRGVYKIVLNGGNPDQFDSITKILNTTDEYRLWESRPDGSGGSIVALSDQVYVNPINSILKTVAYDEYLDRLYAGGEGGIFLYLLSTDEANLRLLNLVPAFLGAAPATDTFTLASAYTLTGNQPLPAAQPTLPETSPPLDISIDVVNRNTIWAATVQGVYRSVDNGSTWEAKAFGTGSVVNTRTIIVDPTNTINVLAGSEDGLYRSTDAGGSWKRIRSGLGNHKTITSLTQAAGLAGARRKVWVGTAGGVFMGKQSLDLE